MPALRPLLGGRGHEKLAVRLREHEGADVPAVQHHVVGAGELALQLHHLISHDGERRDIRCGFGHVRLAKVRRDILAAHIDLLHAVLIADVHHKIAKSRAYALFVIDVDAALQHEICHAAVHCARVEIDDAEPLRDRFCDGALARSRRPVDCDVYHVYLCPLREIIAVERPAVNRGGRLCSLEQ